MTYSTRKHSGLEFQVAAIPGFTVGAVRAVLGRETRSKLSDTFVNDGFGGPQGKARIVKGQLDYENRSQPIDFEKNVLTFLVKLDPHPDRPIYEHLNDNDGIEHVYAGAMPVNSRGE